MEDETGRMGRFKRKFSGMDEADMAAAADGSAVEPRLEEVKP